MLNKDPKLGHSTWVAIAAFVVLSLTLRAEGSFTYTVVDLTLGGRQSEARGINDMGQVVGYSTRADGQERAFLYTNGVMTDLGTLGGNRSIANDINNAGQVVGILPGANGQARAFLYSDGEMIDIGSLNGGVLGHSFTTAFGINDAGQIVGQSTANIRIPPQVMSVPRAFLYGDGVMTDLGTLGGTESSASGINDAGQIVGSSSLADGSYHAFLYIDDAMIDLNSLIDPASGWTLVYANAINNAGQIVGWGYNAQGEQHGFLLAPATPVPEPSSIVLSGMGLIGLVGYIGRRRLRSAA